MLNFYTIERFTQRDCWKLAIELHDLTGWPIWCLADQCDEAGQLSWFHVVVEHPDGSFVDVNGAWTDEALLYEWSEHFESSDCFEPGLYPITLKELFKNQANYKIDKELRLTAKFVLNSVQNTK